MRTFFSNKKKRQTAESPVIPSPATRSPHRRSRIVGLLKLVLPSLSALLLGLVVVWPQIAKEKERFKLDIGQGPSYGNIEKMEMLNARFYGTDNKNQPFSLTADTAFETEPGSLMIELASPKADIQLSNGSWAAAQAKTGTYKQKEEKLSLTGGIQIFHDDGYSLRTEAADLDFKTGKATGPHPVEAHGPLGAIQATGFKAIERGDRLIFTGPATLTLRLSSKKDTKE